MTDARPIDTLIRWEAHRARMRWVRGAARQYEASLRLLRQVRRAEMAKR